MSDPTIDDAIDSYLDKRRDDGLLYKTVRSHRYRLNHVREWAKERDDVERVSDLSPSTLVAYRRWRKEKRDINTVTLHTQMVTVRRFIVFAANMGWVSPDLPDRVPVPSLDNEQESSDEMLDMDRADDILEHLRTYEYASKEHVIFELFLGTGRRLGGVRALDVDDVDLDEQLLRIRHRPETGTPLKNRDGGETVVAIDNQLATVLNDYIEDRRIGQTDEYGRRPLLTTRYGRIAEATIRRITYRWTQPCQIGKECPHGTTKEACDVAGRTDNPSGCPSTRSPHTIRRAVLTEYRREDVPDRHISGRVDVSRDVLDRHYDQMTERERAEKRREFFE